jgi:hypothetical protein
MRRYRARRRAAGLRLERRWVPAAGPRVTAPPLSDHRILDARSLAMHALIARKIARDARLIDVARRSPSGGRSSRDRGGRSLPCSPIPERKRRACGSPRRSRAS